MAVQILDTTLRDGEQSPGVYFTLEEKLELAQGLSDIGVPIIEAGIPAMGECELELLRELRKLQLRSEIQTWLRLRESDLESAIASGADCVHISVPLSPIMIEQKLRSSYVQVFQHTVRLIEMARSAGRTVSIGAEDASRTPDLILQDFFVLAQDSGAARVRFADTLGIMTPDRIGPKIGPLCSLLRIPLDYHAHNDFGLAAANSHAAWSAGAQILSCTLLGLGERAGNTAMEEIAAILQLVEGIGLGINFPKLRILCDRAAEMSGRQISPDKPLFGELAFTHESGIHVDGLYKAPQCYEPYAPGIFGARRKIVIGKHSGRTALRRAAAELGYRADDAALNSFIEYLRRRMQHQKQLNAHTLLQEFLQANCPQELLHE